MVSYVRRIYNLYSKDKLKLLRESLDEYTETQGWEKIRFSSGEARTIKAISYNNTRLQSIYDIRVLKELYQAVGRIRPYRPLKTNEQVTVYLVTDVPMRWYEIEKLRPSLNNFIRTKPASCHPSHREKLRKIAKVVKTVPPKFMSKDFYSAYELQFGPQSRKQRNVLRKLLNQHAESLGIAPPRGSKADLCQGREYSPINQISLICSDDSSPNSRWCLTNPSVLCTLYNVHWRVGMISFGEFMRVTRENQGMSLRELARRLDVVPSYVSQVERDLASIPTEPRLLIIANELNIDGDELMAKAGRVPSDIADAFIANPKGVSSLIRRAVKQGFR